MSGTNPGDRSAAEIEREVERTRARLTGTVEELKERVSPAQLTEQAMDWLRSSGGRQFASNLGTALRDNPMPVLLVAAGIGWLAMASGRDDRPRGWGRPVRTGYGVHPGTDYPEDYAGESYPPETYAGPGLREEGRGPSLGERAGETAEGVRRRAGDLAASASATAGEAWQGASETVRSLAGGAAAGGRHAAQRAGEAWEGATETAAQLGERAYRYGSEARRGMADAVEAQPLLLGGIGFALGALLGGLVPHSAAEDRLLGESRDRVANRLSTLAGEAYETAREAAGEGAERAREHFAEAQDKARERMAGSGDAAHETATALGGVARDLREAVERTAQDVAGSARQGAASAEDKAARERDKAGKAGGSATGTPSPTIGPSAATPPPATGSSTGMPPAKPGPQGKGAV